ncbi:MAG: site-2 protease family protein [Candidatus Omnitrophota bacterium]
MNKILSIIIQFSVLIFSVCVHESAHGWMADKCGDPTARYRGRITLNPIHHIDLFGSIIVPLVLAMIGGPVFGWAKPVPVNPYNFNHYRRDNMLVSAAGPGSNLILATLSIVLFRILNLNQMVFQNPEGTAALLFLIFFYMTVINVFLAIFNLIPIPPLDGSGILEGVLKGEAMYHYQRIKPYGFIILIVILYTGALNVIASPIITLVLSLLRG